MRKVSKNGKKYYYYYKKKIGRHKKRGVKAKKKKKVRTYDGTWNYKILRFDFRKQSEYIGTYRTIEDAYKKKNELEQKNSEVEFPSHFIVSKKKEDGIAEKNSEYVIMKRIRKEDESNESMLRNEYGKIVKHVSTSKKYYVFDKFPCLTEETFWVYGHNPSSDRKTFKWIYDNFIEKASEEYFSFVNIYIYNNKVIFRYDGGNFNFVICKNEIDAIRMYNLLQEKYKKDKRLIFTGKVKGHSDRGNEIINMIKEKTGWPLNKIYKMTTAK